MEKADAKLLLNLAIELRLRVLKQLHMMNRKEFPTIELTYTDKETGEECVVQIVGEGEEGREPF